MYNTSSASVYSSPSLWGSAFTFRTQLELPLYPLTLFSSSSFIVFIDLYRKYCCQLDRTQKCIKNCSMQNSPILLFLYSKIHGLYSQKPVPQNVTKLPIHKFWRERRAPPIVKHYMCDSLCAEIFNMVRGVCSICSCRAQLRHDIMASAHG